MGITAQHPADIRHGAGLFWMPLGLKVMQGWDPKSKHMHQLALGSARYLVSLESLDGSVLGRLFDRTCFNLA